MVAVTGATGLLGQHIVEKLVAEGVETVVLHRTENDSTFPKLVTKRYADILNPMSLQTALDGVTAVVHAAAFVSFNPRRRNKIFDVNVNGTRNVIDTCLNLGIKDVIHISSVAALGRKPGENVTEESKWTGLFASDYGTSKYLAELEVFRGAEEGLTVSFVNPSVVLSTYQLHRSSATLFDYAWKGYPFYSEGSLNYVDARDVADAVFRLYRKPQPGQKFILSAGSISFTDFFARVAKQWNRRAPSIRISPRVASWFGFAEEIRCLLLSREPMVTRQSAAMASYSFLYDNSKVQELTGLRFRNIEDTISWCCENYERNVNSKK